MKMDSRNSLTSKLITIFNILILGLYFSTKTFAAPGDIDRSFGIDGFSKAPIGSSTDEVYDSAIQPDGKIIVIGLTRNGSFDDFFVARFNANGTLDNTFDGDGKVITTISNRNDYASSVVLQPDGKILVVGTTTVGDTNDNTAIGITRYNTDGSLDTSFDGDGLVINSSGNEGFDGAVLPDGKILVLSRVSSNAAIFRYNSDGSPDTTFGINGRVIPSLSGLELSLRHLAVQQDGKILLAGFKATDGSGTSYNFAVVRLNQNGTLDASFDSDGIVVTKVSSSPADQDVVNAILVQSDNKIVLVGYSFSGSITRHDFAAVRYNPNGSLDQTFDGDGKVVIPFGNDYDSANAVALQADGKLVLAGNSIINSDSTFALARLDTGGSLDSTFGNNGKVITFIPPARSVIRGVHIQPDGKIVASGDISASVGSSNTDVVLARYQVRGIREADFDGDKLSDISVFRPTDSVWYLLRSQSGFSATQFGISSDKITPADFDGDGRTDIAVFRDGYWYWLNSLTGNFFNAVQFGTIGDIPVPADYTGDGRAELAVFRSGFWYTFNLANNQFQAVQFGITSDKPVQADYDGDGKTDFAVFRDGNWFYLRSSDNQFRAVQFGLTSDKPAVGDYDGDGIADPAVFRSGVWYVLGSIRGFYAVQFGIASDIPVAADYDDDGRTDVAVFREGNWYWLQSSNNLFRAMQWGISNDKPIQASIMP